ncbi:flagellar FliJ protein [Actimicrobium sp. GrIS 1.19]|uniref:flagellar export protein FliJ n=1 Tax=Actimicrobium sp. GrIS 1.19 TaxID=3071708 RepID=UPI002E0790A7|nr:flagellar FliJ protein [Actimicrobium sp. GrIS 1.19]
MATSSAIDTLIELAVKETDEAAKRLGHAIRACDEVTEKLNLLLRYRDEYAARFQDNLSVGLSASGYRNFQLFIDKLDNAASSQQLVLLDAKRRIEEARTAWQASERKRMSYGTLASRALKEEQRKEAKRDQKATDEHAARANLYKR